MTFAEAKAIWSAASAVLSRAEESVGDADMNWNVYCNVWGAPATKEEWRLASDMLTAAQRERNAAELAVMKAAADMRAAYTAENGGAAAVNAKAKAARRWNAIMED